MKKKNILITGSSGFLGSSIINYLSNKDYKFFLLIRKNSNLTRLKRNKNHKYIIIDYERLENIFKKNKIDLIIHCATSYGTKDRNISNIIQSNLFLPLKLLDLAKKFKVKKFVNTDTILKKNISDYTLSKYQFNEWFKKFSKDMYCCNIKIEHFFGPGDDTSKFVISFISKILNKKFPVHLTKGTQKRDFIFIDDVVRAIALIVKHSEKKNLGLENFEIGTGKSITIKNFAKLTARLCNIDSNKFIKFGTLTFRKNEPMDVKININKLKKMGWKPKCNLKSSLKKTINYYRDENIFKTL